MHFLPKHILILVASCEISVTYKYVNMRNTMKERKKENTYKTINIYIYFTIYHQLQSIQHFTIYFSI